MSPPERKRGRPKSVDGNRRRADRHTKPKKAFHDDQEVFDALDRYRKSLEIQPDESAVLRVALREFLAKRGFWTEPQ